MGRSQLPMTPKSFFQRRHEERLLLSRVRLAKEGEHFPVSPRRSQIPTSLRGMQAMTSNLGINPPATILYVIKAKVCLELRNIRYDPGIHRTPRSKKNPSEIFMHSY